MESLRALQDWFLKYELKTIPGVAEVASVGGAVKEYQIIPDPVKLEQYGVTVALVNNHVISNRLEDIAGKTRNIPEGCELLTVAKRMGISLG